LADFFKKATAFSKLFSSIDYLELQNIEIIEKT